MKKLNLFSIFCSTIIGMSLSISLAFAHSGHDHSKLPLKWKFSKAMEKTLKYKIQNNIFYVGLSKYDQKLLKDYHVQVGNIFESNILGKSFNFKFNSMGLEILGTNYFSKVASSFELPFRSSNLVSNVGIHMMHPGHDHKKLPIEWIVNEKLRKKINKRLNQSNAALMIGLNSHSSKTLSEHGVKIGNSFKIMVNGQSLKVLRVSGGIRVENVNNIQIASL